MSFDPYAPYGPVVETTVRLVTWNVWGRYGNWEDRQAGIQRMLAKHEPDVVCLVESWAARRLGGGRRRNTRPYVVEPQPAGGGRPLSQPSLRLRPVGLPRAGGVGHPVCCELLGVTESPDQPQLSDHYGVLADLRY